MSDPIPAVGEAAATGEIAEIFADIRRVLGVEVVNLIWRHLATLPGGLPWAWETLRPLYADGTLAAEARLLHEQLTLPRLRPFPPELLAAADLAEGDIASIRDILAASRPDQRDGAHRVFSVAPPAGGAALSRSHALGSGGANAGSIAGTVTKCAQPRQPRRRTDRRGAFVTISMR